MTSGDYPGLVNLIGSVDDKVSKGNFIFQASKTLAKSGYGNDFECIEKVRSDYREWLEKRGLYIKYDGKTAANYFALLKRFCRNGASLSDESWTAINSPPNQNKPPESDAKKIHLDLNDISIGIEIAVSITGDLNVAKFLLSKISNYIHGNSIYMIIDQVEFEKFNYYLDKNSPVNQQWRLTLARLKN